MIRFILNDKEVVTDLPAGTTVLDFIRYHQHLMGTKIGCREGDCGACTILVGSIKNDQLDYQTMTSCLMPLANAHGKHIVTIEGINFNDQLNPVQQAMADAGATQCGFCTPGFVISLAGFCLQNSRDAKSCVSTENAIAAIDGNICRCTGYKSIERAAFKIAELLKNKNGDEPTEYLSKEKILPEYFANIKSKLQSVGGNGLLTNDSRLPTISVGGGTDLYVQRHEEMVHAGSNFLFDDPRLKQIIQEDDRCIIGAAVTVTDLLNSSFFNKVFPAFSKHAKLVSSTPIRNMATIAGNFVNASPIGDLTIFFLALDAQVYLTPLTSSPAESGRRTVALREFYKGYKQMDKHPEEYIEKIWFKIPGANHLFNFEKVSKRTNLDIASVNTAISIEMHGNEIANAGISAGGVAPVPFFLQKTSELLKGKKITIELINNAVDLAKTEISPISDARGSKEYKTLLLGQLIKAHLAPLSLPHGGDLLTHNPAMRTSHKAWKGISKSGISAQVTSPQGGGQEGAGNIDSYTHVRGESVYLDDIPLQQGTLFAVAFDSSIAHGKIKNLDVTEAAVHPGVVKVFTAKDIPGENEIGGIIPDEPLLADKAVHFCGMPIALVVAKTEEQAREAVKKIKVEIEKLEVITDPRIAQTKNELIIPPRTFRLGNVDSAWADCQHVFEGKADTNGQEHLYIETQGAYCLPTENGGIKIYSSTQGPTAVQRTIAKVLGVPMHAIEVDVTRLGGGFGGKEDQANAWAALCALATFHLRQPVKYSLHRMEDMRMTGKRHPYSSDFKIGLDKDLKILAYEVTFYQNAGAAADLSPAVLERTLFHCTNSYFVPNVKATAYSCRTNLPPNTAFRGFGGPQGMFVIEAAIAKAAENLGIDACIIQQKNLINTGDEFPYGQKANSETHACWNKLDELYDIKKIKAKVEEFNSKNKQYKKGFAVMPICFGISFTKTRMNQARSLVHVYTDGSVGVSTGAVEMGQGVNTKVLQVAAKLFSLDASRIKIQTSNTFRIANTSPSAASATADLNGKATLMACTEILKRLKEVAAIELKANAADISIKEEWVYINDEKTTLSWNDLVITAYSSRVSLSEHAHYTPPGIHFDQTKEKGHPFAYHTYGAAIIIATIDCLRGIYEIDSVNAVHDAGKTMNAIVDMGQCEGGIVQGIGWMTIEELLYNKEGKLMTNALSTYKVPDIYAVPKEINVQFLETTKENLAVLQSKAVGEPPLMYGIGAYFALRNAVKAFNPAIDISFDAPMTPEKVLMNLYSQIKSENKAVSTKQVVVDK